jgi:hypothetical protein
MPEAEKIDCGLYNHRAWASYAATLALFLLISPYSDLCRKSCGPSEPCRSTFHTWFRSAGIEAVVRAFTVPARAVVGNSPPDELGDWKGDCSRLSVTLNWSLRVAPPAPFFRDEFQLKEKSFTLPENSIELDPRTKRSLTICNLFVNHKLSVSNIQRVLDEDYGKIVQALLEHGILQDRRRIAGRQPVGIERRKAPSKVRL